MADAFIKIYRKMLDWEWYDDNNTKIVFLHCLLKANWKPCKWHGIEIQPGQFITSLQTLADETQLTVKQVRTALDHLISTGEVASIRQSKCRVITVNNWVDYQGQGQSKGNQRAIKGQDEGNQRAIDKEYKEKKEEKEVKELKNLYYPNDEKLDRAFTDFVAMRKQIKKPLTERAIDIAMKKINDLSGGDNDKAIKIIEQSIMNGWQGLFPLKNDQKTQGIDWSKV